MIEEPCGSCGEGMPRAECPQSPRECGHHCNCSWTQDVCHYCHAEFGLHADMLKKGGVYRLPGFIGPGFHVIRIVSIGPKMVRYVGLEDGEWTTRSHRHPRVLFNSWDGQWQSMPWLT